MKKIFALVIVVPILALFGGIGVLAYHIAGTWDERNTDVLITGIITACGIGGLVIALALAAFVGLIFYARWQQDRSWGMGPGWRSSPKVLPAPDRQGPWLDMPPALPEPQAPKGRLYSSGPSTYEDLDDSLFADTQSDENQWS